MATRGQKRKPAPATVAPESTGEKQRTRGQFKPGQSGNPAGRPKGSRNKLSEDFVRAVAEDFETEGIEAIRIVRETKPDAYLRIVADLVPKDFKLEHDVTDTLAALLEKIDAKPRRIPSGA